MRYRISKQPYSIDGWGLGRPRIVYTRRLGGAFGRDTFWYAYHNGEKWVSRKIVEAGAGRQSFTSGGASLDHEDPPLVYLSRTIGDWNQVERWFTSDDGRTWTAQRLTGAHRVPYSRGDETTIGFTDYRTRIHALDF